MNDDEEPTPQPTWPLRAGSEDAGSSKWPIGSKRIPKAEIVFFTQAIIIFTVIVACIFNLSRSDRKDETIWTTLLGSSLGYMLPNPKLKK